MEPNMWFTTQHPAGWWYIGGANEYSPDITRVEIMGKKFVFWRPSEGSPKVLCEAFCPHMGNDLSRESCVKDQRLVCGFHGQKFDAFGYNTKNASRIQSFHVEIRSGLNFAWINPRDLDGDPWFPCPDIEFQTEDSIGRIDLVRTPWINIFSNFGDRSHLSHVHGADLGLRHTGGVITDFFYHQVFSSDGVRFDMKAYGPGIVTVDVELERIGKASVAGLSYPIDGSTTGAVTIWRSDGAPANQRLAEALYEKIGEDFGIWEAMRTVEPDYDPGEDKELLMLHNWLRKFYQEKAPQGG